MERLRYDPKEPDFLVVRQAVLARLATGEWGQESLVSVPHVRQSFEGFVEFIEPTSFLPGWEQAFASAVQEVIWQLVVEGVICPGGFTGHGLNFPWLRITDYGQRFLQSRDAHPHEVERFLERMRNGSRPLDKTVEAYLSESLRTFRQNYVVASAVMLGIAAERVFILIAEALAAALSSQKEQAALRALLAKQPMKPKLDWVHRKLQDLDAQRPRLQGLPESAPIMITAIYDLLRQQRNDLGHPRDTPPSISRDPLEANLRVFASFYRVAEELRDFLANHSV